MSYTCFDVHVYMYFGKEGLFGDGWVPHLAAPKYPAGRAFCYSTRYATGVSTLLILKMSFASGPTDMTCIGRYDNRGDQQGYCWPTGSGVGCPMPSCGSSKSRPSGEKFVFPLQMGAGVNSSMEGDIEAAKNKKTCLYLAGCASVACTVPSSVPNFWEFHLSVRLGLPEIVTNSRSLFSEGCSRNSHSVQAGGAKRT